MSALGGEAFHSFEALDGGAALVPLGWNEEVPGLLNGLAVDDVDEGVAEWSDIGVVGWVEKIAGEIHGFIEPMLEVLVVVHGAKAADGVVIDAEAETFGSGGGDVALDIGEGEILIGQPADEGEALGGSEAGGEGVSADFASTDGSRKFGVAGFP